MTSTLNSLLAACLWLVAAAWSAAPATASDKASIERIMALRWVAYAPTNFNPGAGGNPSDEGIRADLAVLKRAGFDGIVTYGVQIKTLPAMIAELGFKGMLPGVWDPKSTAELDSAIEQARQSVVLGLIIGNEGIMRGDYNLADLEKAMATVRGKTDKPVTTTEVAADYFSKPELIDWSDLVLANAHPFWYGRFEPTPAVEWTVATFRNLEKRAKTKGKRVLFKEVGMPTAGQDGLSEENQRAYYKGLQQTGVPFVWFEAFDLSWKAKASGKVVEGHWGLWREDRTRKAVVSLLPGGQQK